MSSARPLTILFHPDPLRLEAALVERVRAIHDEAVGAGGIPRILVLAASRRQVHRARCALASSAGALLGVEVLTHLGLARRILDAEDEPPPSIVPGPLREGIVEEICALRPEVKLAAYANRHLGVAGALAGLFGELREAGVGAEALRRVAGAPATDGGPGADDAAAARGAAKAAADPGLAGDRAPAADADSPPVAGASTTETGTARDLAGLFALYEAAFALLEQERPALTDRAGFVRRAARAAPSIPAFDAVFQIGAYDLVGMNLELLSAVSCARPAVVLVPADFDAPAWDFARAFAERHLGAAPRALPDAGPARPFVRAARAWRDPAATPEPLPGGALRFVTAQGPEAELTVAAREALRLAGAGAPLDRMAIVARTLEPYAAIAPPVFARHTLPIDTSLRFPLARHPRARAFLLLLRTLAGDFARADVIELARSTHLALPAIEDGARWTPDVWDRLSRRHRIVRGASEWTHALLEAVESEEPPETAAEEPDAAAAFEARRGAHAASVRVLGGAVAAWAEEAARWRAASGAAAQAAVLGALGARWIRGWGAADPAGRALAGILEERGAMEGGGPAARAGAGGGDEGRGFGTDDALAFVARALEETSIDESVPGGVAFLDLMQARGLAFDHVFFVGFNANLVPRRPREDPFLPDLLRRRLSVGQGVPLAARLDAFAEETVLLASLLASTTTSLTVSWQRADAEGKALPHSLQLRELLRFLPGAPALGTFAETAPARIVGGRPLLDRVPAHPREAAGWYLARHGFLSRGEAALRAAGAAPRAAAERVGAFLGALDPAERARLDRPLRMARAVDDFDGRALEYDGVLGAEHRFERRFSASGLERLGRCPQTFFFQNVLGIRPLDETAEETRLDALELGSAVHRVLERVFGRLRALRQENPEAPWATLRDAARAALDEEIGRSFARTGARIRRAFPGLWSAVETAWRSELREYGEREIARFDARGFEIAGLEERWEADVSLAPPADSPVPPAVLPLDGRIDRAARDRQGRLLVSDYKTGRGNLREWVQPGEYLSGQKLQLPVYLLLAEARGETGPSAELIGLGPGFLPERGFLREDAVPTLDTGVLAKHPGGLAETLAVFAALALAGRFPFRTGHHCGWCAFRPACRRHHHASRVRQEGAPEFADYRDVLDKSSTRPTLAAVRATRAEEGEDEA